MNVSWWGKIFGGTFGFMFGGPLGGMLGAAFGHSFDRGLWSLGAVFGLDAGGGVHPAFFTATFQVMGCVAVVDDPLNRREFAAVRNAMVQMGLNSAQERLAIELLHEGMQPDFDLDTTLRHFCGEFRRCYKAIQLFIEIQLAVAYADGRPNAAERELLLYICDRLQFPRFHFDLLDDTFYTRYGGRIPSRSSITGAYAVLGLKASATELEIKSAYRRLLNRHHPDKLIARQASEEALKVATERTWRIMAAYERIRTARGF